VTGSASTPDGDVMDDLTDLGSGLLGKLLGGR
jgi:hypothetical protein